MKRKIFKVWIAMWCVILMGTMFTSSFAWLPVLVAVGGILFLLWFGLSQVCPQVDWDDISDVLMAYSAIGFFGTMFGFIVPCLYELNEALEWNDWCQWMVLGWMLSILVSLGTLLVTEYKIMKGWKYAVAAIFLVVLFAFIMSLLGFLFNVRI